jgi:hypothetical protein
MGLDVADTRTWAEGFVHRLIAFFAGTYYRPVVVAGDFQHKWLGAFSHSFIKQVEDIEPG